MSAKRQSADDGEGDATEELEPLVVELCPERGRGERDVQLLLVEGVVEELGVELLREQVHVHFFHDGGHEPECPERAERRPLASESASGHAPGLLTWQGW